MPATSDMTFTSPFTFTASALLALFLWRRRVRNTTANERRPLTRLPGSATTPSAVAAALRRDGAVIVDGLVRPSLMAALSDDVAALEATEYSGVAGSFAGSLTHRCGPYVLGTSPSARQIAAHPLAVAAAKELLAPLSRRIRLSVVACIRVLAGQPAQVLHRDDDEWPLALLGATSGRGLEIEVSALWAISDFRASNGATNVVVGSHGSHDPNDPVPAREQCQFAEMKAGSVLFFTGSVWHGAGAAVAGEGDGETSDGGETGDGETGGGEAGGGEAGGAEAGGAEAGCGEAAGGGYAGGATAVGGKTRAPSAVLRRGRQGILVQYIAGWLHPEYNLHFALPPETSAAFEDTTLRALLGFDGPRLFDAGLPGPVYATHYTGYPDRKDVDFSAAPPP